MQQNRIVILAFIVILTLLAVWINLPTTESILGRTIQTRLGLDLVGGVQALLEADLPADQAIDAETMSTAVSIIENRVNGLGVTEAVVQQAGERRIVVELPGETDPETALAVLGKTGLLEFVDLSSVPQEFVASLVGTSLLTDLNVATSVQATQTVTSTAEIYHTVMTGAELKTVNVVGDQLTNEPQVGFELSDEGAQIFRDYTTAHVGQVLGIALDGVLISAPRVDEPITDGQGVIRGSFDIASANALAVQLRYGSLPIPLKIVETRTVGPTLGQDSLQKSMIAGIIGFAVAILFMALYYRLPGVVAVIAILIYAVLAFALFRYIPITLTLPGIAGFLLSTGSALDANILIFERLKEELRAGKRLDAAVTLGWQRAWPSIRDSNLATLITCAILFWFGNTFGATIVKGFSLTLALGVTVSLFTAIVVSRNVLALVLQYSKPTNLARWFGI